MNKIKIIKKEETGTGWRLEVEVDGIDFTVTVSRDFWEQKTGGQEEPESLIRRSFEFLLEREPKEAILSEFDLTDISKYFPEYEDEIKVNGG